MRNVNEITPLVSERKNYLLNLFYVFVAATIITAYITGYAIGFGLIMGFVLNDRIIHLDVLYCNYRRIPSCVVSGYIELIILMFMIIFCIGIFKGILICRGF
jgi:hypothetical protein